MNFFEPIDIYCERIDATLLSEPLNALSNLAFFIAAFYALRLYRKEGRRDNALLLVIALIFAVAVGSSLFHTFANVLTQFADVIPIVMFVFTSLWLMMRKLLRYDLAKTTAAFVFLIAMAMSASYLPWRLNGSIAYVPCLVMLIYIGIALKKRQHTSAHSVLIAAIIFTASLTFRTIDMDMCETFHYGTHLFWHMLNGLVLYFVARALIVNK